MPVEGGRVQEGVVSWAYRGLIWPTYSFPGNVATDSLYIIARNQIRVMPEVFWYLITPDWEGKEVHDELDDLPNVVKVPTPMSTLYRAQESSMDPEMLWRFSPQEGRRPVELCIQHSPQRLLNMANAWAIRIGEAHRPVLVNYDLLARDDRGKEYPADEIELMQIAAGYWAADWNVNESEIVDWMATYNARKFLSPSATKRVRDRCVLIEQGVAVGKLDETMEGVSRRKKFTVYYGGRFAESKRFDDIAETIDAVYRFGREIEFVVCTGSLSGIVEGKFRKRFPQVELHIGTNQYEAWKIMSECHATICMSRGELFGLAFWEQIAAGLAVVMKHERWNEDMLPPEYPLWVDSKHEVAARIRMLFEEWSTNADLYDSTYSRESWWAQYVRGRYDADLNLRVMHDLMMKSVYDRRQKVVESIERGAAQPYLEVIDAVMRDGMTLDETITAMKKESRIGRGFVGQLMEWGKSLSTLQLYKLLRLSGWEDIGGEEPLFERSKS